jgi:hypothetical protein
MRGGFRWSSGPISRFRRVITQPRASGSNVFYNLNRITLIIAKGSHSRRAFQGAPDLQRNDRRPLATESLFSIHSDPTGSFCDFCPPHSIRTPVRRWRAFENGTWRDIWDIHRIDLVSFLQFRHSDKTRQNRKSCYPKERRASSTANRSRPCHAHRLPLVRRWSAKYGDESAAGVANVGNSEGKLREDYLGRVFLSLGARRKIVSKAHRAS